MNLQKHILDLVNETLQELQSGETPLGSIVQRAIRIARLRNDFDNLWWLQMEMLSDDDQEAKKELALELGPHYTKEEYRRRNEKYINLFIEERRCQTMNPTPTITLEKFFSEKKGINPNSVSGIEEALKTISSTVNETPIRDNLAASQTVKSLLLDMQNILDRIRRRINEFLTIAEKQLIYGQIQSDIFERNRRYVDSKLGKTCPDVLEKFVAVYRRLDESETDIEARSQALTSCRRILKALADTLYPPRKELVTGSDGKQRTLNDAKFVSRLWQYVWEKTKDKTSGKLVVAQLQDVGNRIDHLNNLSSKGVHGKVSRDEVDQCVIQTYLICGDVLRISENH